MDISILIGLIYVLILATYVGFELIAKVPPLMSGSNAISGITIVGALICTGNVEVGYPLSKILGIVALFLATLNVVGGYAVTDRMLKMFKKK